MAVVKVYDQNKKEVGDVNLSSDVFEVEVRPEILNLMVRSQLAARRSGTHSSKTRANVSGGGAKPWRQKGTGRARAGSNRSPIWRGGGVIFGPQPRDYSFKVNSKVRALALKMALSSRLAANTLMIVKDIKLAEIKTKLFADVASTLGLNKALIVVPEDDNALTLSTRNLQNIALTTPAGLSVYEILKYKQLVILEKAVEIVQARFQKKGGE